MKIFVSVATYELGKRLGVERAAREFLRMCERPLRGDLPAARMVARLRELGDVALYHGASTTLPKLRSRAADAAWQSGADLWVMVDDDVECDTATLARLIKLAGDARVSVLPCAVRGVAGDAELNVRFAEKLVDVAGGIPFRRAELAGTGCMVVTRAALQRVRDAMQADGKWIDDDGQQKLALFEMHRDRESGEWFGEDFSFCRRLRAAGVQIRALMQGVSSHDNQTIQLESIE
jgi:hypothetical protein